MTQPSPPNPGGDRPAISDAELLFKDDPPSPPRVAPAPSPAPVIAPSGDAYTLDDPDAPGADLYSVEGHDEEANVALAPVPGPQQVTTGTKPTKRVRTEPQSADARVDQVWSRPAEWGPSIAILVVVAVGIGIAFYQTFYVEALLLPFYILVAGAGLLALLSYPIVITLERPVRITPEQAVKDYYNALSYHFPHYRRMWLLLSNNGRRSGAYSSYGGFKRYWRRRIASLKRKRVGRFTPLVFKIEDFKSDKIVGKTTVEAKFSVHVFIWGHETGTPYETIKVEMSMVRGPDQMWYLNKGTLPGERL